jgi:hypothetical protein
MSQPVHANEKASITSARDGARHGHVDDLYDEADGVVDPVYHAKARILNDALQEIGMGKYQVCTFLSLFALGTDYRVWLVDPLRRRRLRLVRVRPSCSGVSLSLTHVAATTSGPSVIFPSTPHISYSHACLDRYWPHLHPGRAGVRFQGSVPQARAEHRSSRRCRLLGPRLGCLGPPVSQVFTSMRRVPDLPRRWAFNLTLLITGVFGVAAGGSPNSVALCALAAVWSIGVGGNLPVDSAVFLGGPR